MPCSSELLWTHAGEAINAILRPGSEGSYHSDDLGWSVATGEMEPSFNIAYVNLTGAASNRLESDVEMFRGLACPFTVCTPQEASGSLAERVKQLGLRSAGVIPLMVQPISEYRRIEENPAIRVEEAVDDSQLLLAQQVAAESFGISYELLTKAKPVLTAAPIRCTRLIASIGGELLATAVLAFHGDCVSFWSMATAPEARRQGLGRHLLDYGLAQATAETYAFLLATEMGLRLYRQAGFTVHSIADAWVGGVGVSAEALRKPAS